jgi:hypothetical protein
MVDRMMCASPIISEYMALQSVGCELAAHDATCTQQDNCHSVHHCWLGLYDSTVARPVPAVNMFECCSYVRPAIGSGGGGCLLARACLGVAPEAVPYLMSSNVKYYCNR